MTRFRNYLTTVSHARFLFREEFRALHRWFVVDVFWWSRMNGRCWVSCGVLCAFRDLSLHFKPVIYFLSSISGLVWILIRLVTCLVLPVDFCVNVTNIRTGLAILLKWELCDSLRDVTLLLASQTNSRMHEVPHCLWQRGIWESGSRILPFHNVGWMDGNDTAYSQSLHSVNASCLETTWMLCSPCEGSFQKGEIWRRHILMVCTITYIFKSRCIFSSGGSWTPDVAFKPLLHVQFW